MCQQGTPIDVQRSSKVKEVRSPSSVGMEPVSSFKSVQKEWQGNVSQWDSHNMPIRHTNPRTESQSSQGGKISEFRWNGTREFIQICSKRMARKCEPVGQSCERSLHNALTYR
jgi:hypothetical protein